MSGALEQTIKTLEQELNKIDQELHNLESKEHTEETEIAKKEAELQRLKSQKALIDAEINKHKALRVQEAGKMTQLSHDLEAKVKEQERKDDAARHMKKAA